MKTKITTNPLRIFSGLVLIALWMLLIRMLVRTDAREIGLLGFLSGVAFLIFSLQWTVQQLVARRYNRKVKVRVS